MDMGNTELKSKEKPECTGTAVVKRARWFLSISLGVAIQPRSQRGRIGPAKRISGHISAECERGGGLEQNGWIRVGVSAGTEPADVKTGNID